MELETGFGAVRFSDPVFLAFSVAVVLAVFWRLRALPVAHRGARRRGIQAAMGLAALTCALAIGGLEVGARTERLAVIFVVDRSRSVGEDDTRHDAITPVQRASDAMRAGDRAGLVVFGAEAATEVEPSARPSFGVVNATIGRDGTDIAAALRHALADLPAEHAGRIVLITDGVETAGDAVNVAAIAAGRGVPIDVLPIERAPRPEIAIDRVRAPEHAQKGEPLEIRIVTRATRRTRARVRVFRDGTPIATSDTEIREGADALTLEDIAGGPGVHRYDAQIEPLKDGADLGRENNEGGAFVRVAGGARALVLTERIPEANALAEVLRRAGFEAEVRDRGGAPPDLETLAGYDLLVLSDFNARSFSSEGLSDVQRFVRDLGGGLLMLGVHDAFGPGGYARTPIEEALPATFDLRNRRDRASLAMLIAIDKSGSMGVEVSPGTTKLALANEAASRSVQLLSPMDRVGVLHIDTEVAWTLPLRNVEDPDALTVPIRRAQVGGGGILVDLTLTASYRALRNEPTQLKHLLLFSDGSDSEEMTRAPSIVAAAHRDRITTSVVSMGRGPDSPALERLSRLGEGRFYIVEDLRELPRIFTEETIEASRSAFVETPFRPAIATPSAVMRGIDFASAPPLLGHVVMNQRPGATRVLTATKTDPMLLTWQHGLGRSATFSVDAGGGPFGAPWSSWSGYASLFGQLARHLSRAPEHKGVRAYVTIESDRGHIRVDAMDEEGRYRNHLDLRAAIAASSAPAGSIRLTQTAAGRYEADFDAAAPGSYLVTISDAHEGLLTTTGAVRSGGEELRGEGTDHAKIAQIAAISGGRVLLNIDRVFRDRPPPIYAYRPLWRELLIASLLALLTSVALRRLVLPWAGRTDRAEHPRNEPSSARNTTPEAMPPDAASEEAPRQTTDLAPPPPAGPRTQALAERLLSKKKSRR